MPLRRVNPQEWYSTATVHAGIVYLSGQVAADTSQDIEGQTRQVFEKIDQELAACETNKSNIIMMTIYLRDMGTFRKMNDIWLEWIDPDSKPCRATVQVGLGTNYEIEVTLNAAI